MDFIISVLKDFYECCNISVKAISCHLDEIYTIGYNDYFNNIYPSKQIEDAINNLDNTTSSLDIKIDDDIYYKIVNISKFNKNKGYFVLGPILNKPSGNNKYNIPYRSIDCSNYISRFILDISDDKFKKNMDNKSYNPYIRKAIEYVHENYAEDITIDNLCNYLDINKCYFCSLFKKSTGNTFSYFLNHFRIEKSKKLLKDTDLNLLEIAISVGFNNQNYYSMVFKKYTSQSPSRYRACSALQE